MAKNNMPAPAIPQPQGGLSAEEFEKMAEEQAQKAKLEVEKEELKKKLEQPKPIQVVALFKGFIHGQRKVEGDVFTLASEKEFSKVWMKKI